MSRKTQNIEKEIPVANEQTINVKGHNVNVADLTEDQIILVNEIVKVNERIKALNVDAAIMNVASTAMINELATKLGLPETTPAK